jgi:HAD superfamily hydrolase (TIGR01509 family)
MGNPYGVLWDMDGVLVDTGEFHFRAWMQTLPGEGLPFDRDTFRRTFGMNNAGILALLLGREPETAYIQRVSDLKEANFRQAIHGQAQPLPGVLDWLERLKRAGFRQAVASSAPQENIDTLIGALKIGDFFQAVVSAARMPGKPDPAVFLEAAGRLDLPAEACVVVEDAVPGVEAARRAGMKCIAVTTTNPAGALAGADLVVDRLDELPVDAFERLLGDNQSLI